MRGSCRPSLELTLYPRLSLTRHGPAPVVLHGRFLAPASRFLPKSESKPDRSTKNITVT